MSHFKPIVLFLCVLLAACSSISEKGARPNVYSFEANNVSLEVEVLLPDSYYQDSAKTYPVLYLLDGYWNKEPIKTTYHNLRFDKMIPEIIIVSVGYPANITDIEEQRMWDLTPTYDTGFKAGGNAASLLKIFSEEIIPTINQTYRIDQERTILTGHSLAALFTLYVMYEDSSAFTHYAAISPSALWAEKALLKIDQHYSTSNESLPGNLYITYGTDEYAPYVDALEKYVDQLVSRHYLELKLSLNEVKGLRHVGMKSEGFLRGLVWALEDLKPEEPSEFEKKNLEAYRILCN